MSMELKMYTRKQKDKTKPVSKVPGVVKVPKAALSVKA
jgi:hypothetical protein